MIETINKKTARLTHWRFFYRSGSAA